MKKIILILFVASLLFTGCSDIKKTIGGGEEVSQCDNNTTFVGLQEMITEEAIENIKAQNPKINIAKARATMMAMKLAFDSVVTTKKDPNSTQIFCKAKIKITIPTAILNDVEKGYKNLGYKGTFRNLSEGGFEANANNFVKKDVEYNTQPTDDGKEIYYGFDNQTQMNEIITFYQDVVVLEQYAAIKTSNNSVNTHMDTIYSNDSTMGYKEGVETADNLSSDVNATKYVAAEMLGVDVDSIITKQNSKGVTIYCRSDMSLCKTEQEVVGNIGAE